MMAVEGRVRGLLQVARQQWWQKLFSSTQRGAGKEAPGGPISAPSATAREEASPEPAVADRVLCVGAISSVPPEITSEARRVYIYQPARSAVQSGMMHVNDSWRIDFDRHQARWENPLMGWTSSRDAMQGVALTFDSLDAATRFAARQGWNYTVAAPSASGGNLPNWRRKAYGDNFVYCPTRLKFIRSK